MINQNLPLVPPLFVEFVDPDVRDPGRDGRQNLGIKARNSQCVEEKEKENKHGCD